MLALFPKLPDLERALCRIQYRKCRPTEFVATLEAFRKVLAALPFPAATVSANSDDDDLLSCLVSAIPDLTGEISFFIDALQLPARPVGGVAKPPAVRMGFGAGGRFFRYGSKKSAAVAEATAAAAAEDGEHDGSDGEPAGAADPPADDGDDGGGAAVASGAQFGNKSGAHGDDYSDLFRDSTLYPQLASLRQEIVEQERILIDFLPQARRILSDSKIDYVTVSGAAYLLEVPISKFRIVPPTWTKVNETKKVGRFQSPEMISAIAALQRAKDQLSIDAHKAWLHFLGLFQEKFPLFRTVVVNLADLDCLSALAIVARRPDYCRPEVVEEHVLQVDAGRHPMIDALYAGGLGGSYVPNDVALSADGCRCLVVTGPNMGTFACS